MITQAASQWQMGYIHIGCGEELYDTRVTIPSWWCSHHAG